MTDDLRPNPDQLLAELQADEAVAHRGKLKIFFGANAGVGKTWAMLTQAHSRQREGADVLVGLVETHKREETAALLGGLSLLPRRTLTYRDKAFEEFDLDAALARKPQLILVDELAHSNVVGSRHPKRWQDIEELLAAGIDVYTTVNVQHLESLNDIVGSLTGVRVRETVPDQVFDAADDIALVDLPPDELLKRLHEGKVYLPGNVARARDSFFRKGNLIALRELALRRTADRVDAELRRHPAAGSAPGETLLAAIAPGLAGETLVRHTARLAGRLKVSWCAVTVETPTLLRSNTKLASARRNLDLAESLGAKTAMLPGPNVPEALAAYASDHDMGTVVIGKPPRRLNILESYAAKLARLSPNLTVQIVGVAPAPVERIDPWAVIGRRWQGAVWALIGCGISTIIAAQLTQVFDLANVIMLYLLSVLLVSVRFGRFAGALSSLLSVAAFDFFFVPPKMSFTVADTQYLLTFGIMLTVALTLSQMSARLRFQAEIATQRERRTAALYELSQALSGALMREQVVELALAHLAPRFQTDIGLALPDMDEQLHQEGGMALDLAVADWVYRHGEEAGQGTGTLAAATAFYLPLTAPMRVRGVLALIPKGDWLGDREEKRFLQTCAAQIGLALERVHFVEVAQNALVSMEGERLRNHLLSAISHDLRTPITVLLGLASTLSESPYAAPPARDIAHQLVGEIRRMNDLVNNLLDMARLQAGEVRLRQDWQAVEEVVGTSLRSLELRLVEHPVQLDIPADLPLVEFDAVLMERVLVNLVDNAIKYTPFGTPITIAARAAPQKLIITVADTGPGLPPGREEMIFSKFTRGQTESATAGVGLGLALCRAIVAAHGGTITAANAQGGGAVFTVALPRRAPPALPDPENLLQDPIA
ncbi:sensor histidine kinase [Silvimonas soli]|uniref:sensor histidine kinase n=1 Tax=Silvimonas soli TaxID=2980100 RepID=UPI0024B36B46|nr:sensor histidine kinase KdpD [Silvimonas soli]